MCHRFITTMLQVSKNLVADGVKTFIADRQPLQKFSQVNANNQIIDPPTTKILDGGTFSPTCIGRWVDG